MNITVVQVVIDEMVTVGCKQGWHGLSAQCEFINAGVLCALTVTKGSLLVGLKGILCDDSPC